MPLLLIPLLVAGLFVLWVLLLPISIVQRYRYGKARRRVLPWAVRLNSWLLAMSVFAFVASSWVAATWVDRALVDALLRKKRGQVHFSVALGRPRGLKTGVRVDFFRGQAG
jgi:hypothetical protein